MHSCESGLIHFRSHDKVTPTILRATSFQAVLLRSGQPLITANGKRCKEDERLLNSVLAREKRGYIIDTRTQNLAQSAKVRHILCSQAS